jgi:hypothetical protein
LCENSTKNDNLTKMLDYPYNSGYTKFVLYIEEMGCESPVVP